jgi:Imidazolonepropionase and related amidohydrolases
MFMPPRDHNLHLIRQGAGVGVAHGMSYAGALKALTSSPVEVFGLGNRGQIASGKIADLIIWDADPLEPSSMPEKVFLSGKDIDLTTRMSRLTERYTKNKNKPNGYRD